MVNERGEGQRLVYLRVGKALPNEDRGDRLHAQSMFRKLKLRLGHDLTPWVRAEVLRRFDFRCCDSVEQFNEVDRLAMTENRHVKIGADRHEKDDRPRAVDARHYVLGWDNREKRRLMGENIRKSQSELTALDQALQGERTALDTLRRQQEAAKAALEMTSFEAIDFGKHVGVIAALEREKTELETANEAVRSLRKTLAKAEESLNTASQARDATLKQEQSLSEQIAREVDLNRSITQARRQSQTGRHLRFACG